MDVSPKYLRTNEGYFLLNNNRVSNENGTNEINTPFPANFPLCEMEEMPVGENYAPNTYESKRTNELYSWVFNSNGAHYIQRVNSKGECEIVYQGECLLLSANPRHAIHQFRAHMKVDDRCSRSHGKQLLWTDGLHAIGQIDVEAAIATNFFTTPFFTGQCADHCAYIQHCVPQPCAIITAEYVPLEEKDKILSNKLNDRGFQFIYRHVYYDGRASEWSEPSVLHYQNTDGCFEGDDNLPRCMKLRIPIGNPMVEKIEIGYRENMLNDSSDVPTPQFMLYETVEKYNPYVTPDQFWYERTLAPIITSTLGEDCAFDFYFCNDKQCQIIPVAETSRVYNPMPRQPQGILPVKDSLGFYNYFQGNCPISKNETDKFEITKNCDESTCITELVSVTVRAVIDSRSGVGNLFGVNTNHFVWRDGGNFGDADDDLNDQAYFGGMLWGGSYNFIKKGWGQEFSSKARNFKVYIDGTDYVGEFSQWISDRNFQNKEKYGVVSGLAADNTPQSIRQLVSGGRWFYQEYKFLVPKGTKGWIRVSNQDINNGYSNTSAEIDGVIENIAGYRTGSTILHGEREIYFDTCNGSVELEKGFIIHAVPAEVGIYSTTPFNELRAYSGYITDGNGRRVEYAQVYGHIPPVSQHPIPEPEVEQPQYLATTDWNGFYFFQVDDLDTIAIEVRVERDCGGSFQSIKSMNLSGGGEASLSKTNIQIINDAYKNGFFERVRIPVRGCDNLPISGIRVAMSGSKSQVTDDDGYAEFIVRNKYTRNRFIKAVVMDKNACFSNTCNGDCDACMPETDLVQIPQCLEGNTLNVELNGRLNVSAGNKKQIGLKAGGRYPFGFVVKGDCGRMSAVYELPIMDIPRTQDSGRLQFCTLNYDAKGMILPSWATCVIPVRGENLNGYELQWVVDKIERTADRKIKLTIQSLNDYNSGYLGNTNTGYNWLKGDRVEFIRNGNNEVFNSATHGILNYITLSPFHDEMVSGETDAPADFFNQLLIEDDGKLDNLEEGAVIELQRASACTTEPIYFSFGVSLPVENGRLVNETGTFHTFDTFLVRRVIGGRQAQEFEHHAPSDFWGDRFSDIGKPYFTNKYENERRYGRNISMNSPTQFNYYGDLIKQFHAPGQGDIIAMDIKDGRIILAICEHDNFMAESADDLLRVGGDGVVRALPPDAIISDGQPKISGQYGCQYPHIGSILFGDGWAVFADVNNHAYVLHDYQSAQPAGEVMGQNGLSTQCSSYFKRRCQELETFNRGESDYLNHLRFATGYNKATKDVYITIKALRHAGYFNEPEPYIKPNETIVFRPVLNEFTTMASFTPEGYGLCDLFNNEGCAFVTFQNGIPYSHPILSDRFNEFYGVPCDWMLGIALNKYPEKVKRAVSTEVQSQTMWYVKSVTTEVPGFLSEIPAIRMKKSEDKWNGGFLGNKNSREGLYANNNLPRGYYVKVLYIRDNTDGLKYNIFDAGKRVAYSEIDNILIKFTLSEQSGFTGNV